MGLPGPRRPLPTTRRGIWIMAIRPPTLTASIAPVLVGWAVAFHERGFDVVPAAAAMVGALLLQIGANFANDVFDFRRGADTAERLGPPRVTQMGLLSEREVTMGMVAAFALATVMGIVLVAYGGWPIVIVGVASIVGAVIYTGGPWPAGYHALGDMLVFGFFGPVAVIGTVYVQTRDVPDLAILASIPMGCVVTAILVVNNLRDIGTDRKAGKVTLGVVMGDRLTRLWYQFLLVVAFGVALSAWPLGLATAFVGVVALAAPAAARPVRLIRHGMVGGGLNLALKETARFVFVFGALFAAGLAVR